jgi:tRNA wybutosine-synthesizing protein 1
MDNGEKDGKITLADAVRERYEAAQYGIAGRHSGVQICSWTKKALRGRGVCYKQRFYGIDCSRCCQMSPAVAWCQQNCAFCWRPMEWMRRIDMLESEAEEPEAIIESCVEQRRRLINGIGGADDVDRGLFDLSFKLFPAHWAISLSGEPTIYPKLGKMVKALRARKEVRSIFIVTNGQEPERIKELSETDSLPTQLYVSLVACDEGLFKRVNKPVYTDAWERLNRTLGLLKSLDCRTVIRFTLIKGMNDSDVQLRSFATMFESARSDFIEVKSYMYLGLSRERLKMENMAFHEHIRERAERLLADMPSYRLESEDARSRIVLLKRKDSKHETLITTDAYTDQP